VLKNGGLLIDMPGMRELGLLGVGEEIDDGFVDVQTLSKACCFADCTHANEPGCAVREAIDRGELNAEHFQNYRKLKKESDFHELSYADKRQKDRTFGKLVRSVSKTRNKRDDF
jgi:ribosome biogenesis GTPase / thiamine phosphate phosphatase